MKLKPYSLPQSPPLAGRVFKHKMFLVLLLLVIPAYAESVSAETPKTILFHLKTSLKHDDAQICVAYNQIWAALEEGLKVNVLIDADAVNTYQVGWFGKDDIEKFKLPERLRDSLSTQFKMAREEIPRTYGEYLRMLHQKGAEFFMNRSMLVVAGIEKRPGTVENISAKFFQPLSLREMIRLRRQADLYMVY